jgi:hypothetical protein
MRKLDGDKLLNFMKSRRLGLRQMIDKDFNGNPEKLEIQDFEIKFWDEYIERGEADCD